jgi:adenylate cyclase
LGDSTNQRRLAAILAADVAGYTRLVEQDTDGTVAAWKLARDEVIKPHIEKMSGNIIKFTGDGFLAEFPSVQDAVNCAITMQGELSDNPLNFRMGVNVGDIINDGGDVHGEGVNIAARLEALAEPGGICISGDVFNQVRNRIEVDFRDMGEKEIKHVSRPVRVYAIGVSGQSKSVISAPALPDKPSIAVLPFNNMSGDPEQEYFSDGISEDIITELARFQSLFVTARNSSFHYKGKTPNIQDVGRELSVQYVVEGSVRKAGNRVRITAQLIDAATGNHIWAERYDRELADIFDVQDEVVQAIAIAVPGNLEMEAHDQARRHSGHNLTAYECVLRATNILGQNWGSKDAVPFLEQAIEADPHYARAYALLANWHAYSIFAHCVPADEAGPLAKSLADKALQLDPNEAVNLSYLAETYLLIGDRGAARRCIDNAIKINPNHYIVIIYAANMLSWLGDMDEATRWLDLYTLHNPQNITADDEVNFEFYFLAERFDDAVAIADGWQNPAIHLLAEFAATYAHAGQQDKANAMKRQYEILCPPNYSIHNFVSAHMEMCAHQHHRDLWLEGYRKAGFDV